MQKLRDQARVFIYTWVDHRFFSNLDTCNDEYFGDLASEFKKKEISFCYLGYILPHQNYLNALLKISKKDCPIFIFEEFVHFSDVFFSLLVVPKKISKTIPAPLWMKLHVEPILSEELTKNQFNSRSKRAYLTYCACKRLSRRYPLSHFIYPFENHIWEKMVCLGIREQRNDVHITGYAHALVYSLYLSYSISSLEMPFIPLPDRIVVNGKNSKNLLVNSGFDEEKIGVSGAVRYHKFLNHTLILNGCNPPFMRILVAAPANMYEFLEVIQKILLAFTNDHTIEVLIKPHPVFPVHTLKKILPELPDHMKYTNTSVQDLLTRVDLLIYTDTTVSIEALIRGIPVLNVTSDQQITINPLQEYAIIPSVSKPEDIHLMSRELIESGRKNKDRYKEIAHEFFESVHDNYADIHI